jgi:iron complex transport system substrate-binding protein
MTLSTRRIAAALLASAICFAPLAAGAITVRDASGRQVDVKDASRIVSVGGAVTEILYALGLADRVIAVDSTSLFPPDALRQKPNVGYMRALSAEGVLGLNPSLVLAIEGAGPKETIAVLESATVPLVRIPDHYTADGILEKITMIADIVGTYEQGACIASMVARDLKAMAELRAQVTLPKKVLFVISLTGGKPTVAGRNTAAEGIIRLAGAVNAIDAYDGYKQLSDEAVIAAAPDAVLVMRRPNEKLDAATVFATAAFAATPAAAQKSFIAMDGLYLLGFGPRTASAARDLSAQLYPALGRVALPSEGKHGSCY